MSPAPLGPGRYDFDPALWPHADLVGTGADLKPATLISAYEAGMFPMTDLGTGELHWWSPLSRGVLLPERLKISRSLRKSVARYRTTVDRAFSAVVEACADPSRRGGWISEEIANAYITLHRLGWAHSVETWDDSGRLVGGLYGVAIGGLFAGESMFHHARDASKVALVRLVQELSDDSGRLIDTQWQTPHLASLGVEEWARSRYLDRLGELVADVPLPQRWR